MRRESGVSHEDARWSQVGGDAPFDADPEPSRAWRARLHITGAACSGVTTLGAHLSRALGVVQIDTDDAYWLPTDPPYTARRLPQERRALIREAMEAGEPDGWIVSGSLTGWGDALIAGADLLVFVDTPTPVRLARLKARERARYGDRILPGGDMHAIHESFFDWAACYDDPDFSGRSRRMHEEWLSRQSIPVVELDGTEAPEALTGAVCTALSLVEKR